MFKVAGPFTVGLLSVAELRVAPGMGFVNVTFPQTGVPEKLGFPETAPFMVRLPTVGLPEKLGLPENDAAAIGPLTFRADAFTAPLTLKEDPERLPTTLMLVVDTVMIG